MIHHVLTAPCIVKVVQVNQAGQMIHNSGQQIMVHAVPQGAQTIQVATQSGQALQQIQVVPVSSLQVSTVFVSCSSSFISVLQGQTFSYWLHVSILWLQRISDPAACILKRYNIHF
jgi:hypothetical protein